MRNSRTLLLFAVAVAAPVDSSLQPLDLLRDQLFAAHSSKTAHEIKLANDALQSRQFDVAIRLAIPTLKTAQYSDLGEWILFQAYRAKAQDQIQQKRSLSALQQAQLARAAYLRILESTPMSPHIHTAAKEMASIDLIVGDANWGLRKWSAAQQAYENGFFRLQSQSSLTSLSPDSLGRYAETCKQTHAASCIPWIEKFADTTKHGSHRAPKLVATYKGPDLDQTAFATALKLYADEKYSKAGEAFNQLLDDYPRTIYKARARYWLGRALLQEREPEKAQRVFQALQYDSPLTYYGLLASFRTDKPINKLMDAAMPLASDTDTALQPAEAFHLLRAQEFIAEKANDLANIELKEIKSRDALSNEFLIYLTLLDSLTQNTSGSLQILSELGQRGYEGMRSTFGLRMIFPLQFFEIIEKYANQFGIDPILVLSLIKQESAFDEVAGSSVGAQGLMQLMPATALDTESNLPIAQLHQAEHNIRVGSAYLKKLLTKYNGNITLALAAYNAGPTAVDRWIKSSTPHSDMTDFVELITYKETREYVASIFRNYYWYTYQLKGTGTGPDTVTNVSSPQKILDYFWSAKPSSRDSS